MNLKVYAYEKCDTCRKALKFLAAQKVVHEAIPIREQPPTTAELRKMLGYVGGDLRKLFNTAGQDYRTLDMKTRLPKLKVDEALALLASNGNLVKRPFVLGKRAGAVGFREEEWEQLIAGGR
jgi:arsenate reductase